MKSVRFAKKHIRALCCVALAAILFGSILAVGGSAANPEPKQYDIKVSGSHTHTAILREGKLYLCGSNLYGQFPGSSVTRSTRPLLLLSNVKDVAVGPGRTLVLTEKGLTLYGLDPISNEPLDKPLAISAPDVASVYAGDDFCAYLTSSGDLYTWGRNDYGQLGNGSVKDASSPGKVMTGIEKVSAGNSFLLLINKQGDLYGCGDNALHQLGLDDTENRLQPEKLMENVAEISAGNAHSLVVTKDHKVMACGANSQGQVGTDDLELSIPFLEVASEMTTVTSGDSHSLAIATDGRVYGWGDGTSGQLGNGKAQSIFLPQDLGLNFVQIFANSSNTYGVDSDGAIYSWGENTNYLLGKNEGSDSMTPVQIFDKDMNWAFPEDGENDSNHDQDSALPLPVSSYAPFMDGYGGNAMKPEKKITRAEFIKLLVTGLAEYDENTQYGAPSFSDVPTDQWYAPYIAYAEQLDVLQGYEDGTCRPGNTITREEAASMAARILELPLDSVPTKTFSDVSGWSKPYVDVMASTGYLDGYEDGTFRPKNLITRGEAAKMIASALDFAPTDEEIASVRQTCKNPFSDVPTTGWYYPYLLRAAGYGLTPDNQ